MKTNKIIIFILMIASILIIHSCFDNADTSLQTLDKQIRTKFNNVSGTFSLTFKDVKDSSVFVYYNENKSFHAASTMKTPVLYEVFKQANMGLFSLSDSLIVKNKFYSIIDSSMFSLDLNADSQEKLYAKIGKKENIYNLCYEMIVQSSNLATNILIDLVDAKNVTKSMRDLGAKNINVLRGVEDIKAYEHGESNTTTALDLMILFDNMGNYNLIDSNSSLEMINILTDQKFNAIIPSKLPNSVTVAHKTGSITKVMHDSGLVILPNGEKYSIVLLSKDWEDKKIAKEVMSEVSKMIYDYYIEQ